MKVFIFGAGASLGSQDLETPAMHLRAPLVNNLFDDQYRTYASDVNVDRARIAELKDLVGDNSLEEWLTEQWIKLGEPHGKEALAAGRKLFGDLALYVWWTMVRISSTYRENNGYHIFLQKLSDIDDKDGVAFVNFNYDLLLDRAITKLYGHDLSGTIENYTDHNYLKPHGSVNWFVEMRPTDNAIRAQDSGWDQREILFNRIAGNMFKGEPLERNFKILDPANVYLYDLNQFFTHIYRDGKYGYPLVLLPLSTKMDELIDGFMDRIRAEFERLFSVATDVYVIGYRANDSLFKEMISYTREDTKLHVVGRESAGQVQKGLLEAYPQLKPGGVHQAGFMDFVQKMK